MSHARAGGAARISWRYRVPRKVRRQLEVDDRTPMTKLYRSVLDNVGGHREKIGDSTGKLDTIFLA